MSIRNKVIGVRIKYGTNPLYKAAIPSFFTVVDQTFNQPVYCGLPSIFFIFCILVLATSTGKTTQVVINPDIHEEASDKA